jgi:ABC-type uncharacterized transport system ATPase subunit
VSAVFIKTKDLYLLNDIAFYLSELNGEKAKELETQLTELIDNLELKRYEKNIINTKRINEKRKLDKNYARSENAIKLPLF